MGAEMRKSARNKLSQKEAYFPHPFAEVPCGGGQHQVDIVAHEAFEEAAHQPVVVFEVADNWFDRSPPAGTAAASWLSGFCFVRELPFREPTPRCRPLACVLDNRGPQSPLSGRWSVIISAWSSTSGSVSPS